MNVNEKLQSEVSEGMDVLIRAAMGVAKEICQREEKAPRTKAEEELVKAVLQFGLGIMQMSLFDAIRKEWYHEKEFGGATNGRNGKGMG